MRRALAAANAELAQAVNANHATALALYEHANAFMWQAFWQSIALAALFAYLDARRGSPDGPLFAGTWATIERAVWFWPSETLI